MLIGSIRTVGNSRNGYSNLGLSPLISLWVTLNTSEVLGLSIMKSQLDRMTELKDWFMSINRYPLSLWWETRPLERCTGAHAMRTCGRLEFLSRHWNEPFLFTDLIFFSFFNCFGYWCFLTQVGNLQTHRNLQNGLTLSSKSNLRKHYNKFNWSERMLPVHGCHLCWWWNVCNLNAELGAHKSENFLSMFQSWHLVIITPQIVRISRLEYWTKVFDSNQHVGTAIWKYFRFYHMAESYHFIPPMEWLSTFRYRQWGIRLASCFHLQNRRNDFWICHPTDNYEWIVFRILRSHSW